MRKIKTSVSLDPEEIEMLKQDAPRGNFSAYIGDLIRNAHLMVRIPKVGIKGMFYEKLDEAAERARENSQGR